MILSIAASIQHRLEYSNGYFAEDDDGIYLVVQNYLSTALVDNPLTFVNHDSAAVAFVILAVTSIKTLPSPIHSFHAVRIHKEESEILKGASIYRFKYSICKIEKTKMPRKYKCN